MASPKIEAFFLLNLSTNAPLTGQAGSMSFLTYKDTLGNNLSAPSITEVGGGWYQFTPTMPVQTDRGLVYLLDTGPNGNPTRVARYVRFEDYTPDAIPTIQTLIEQIRDYDQGKWQVVTIGPDANRLVIYAADGTTVLKKYDLLDKDGLPTTLNPFKRSPV